MIQERTYHQQADADWVRFEATTGRSYLIEAQSPPGSLADTTLDIYNRCDGPPTSGQSYTFSPHVRVQFVAPASETIYLSLTNHQPEVFGPQVNYRLSVLALPQEPLPGALILVAGRNRSNDPLQPNIHQVTDAVYALFRNHGYGDERIFYLATENRPGRDGHPTVNNLQAAITSWAADKVGSDRALTLFLVDHGTPELIYLDKPSYQWLAPAQLHQWLSQLEAARPGVRVNLIVEACNSGGFINAPHTASGPGRVVITSTSQDKLAWASNNGAVFSDHFLDTLGQGASLYSAFQTAAWAVQATGNPQEPWLDGNGNGIPNEPADQAEAARRGFAYAGTLLDDRWPPYIAQADPVGIDRAGRGRLRVEVRDDVRAQRVWALIYPPSYQPPEEQEDLVWENVASVNLFREGNTDWFGTSYPGFIEQGAYRVVYYAEDGEGLSARPLAVQASRAGAVYLPLIVR